MAQVPVSAFASGLFAPIVVIEANGRYEQVIVIAWASGQRFAPLDFTLSSEKSVDCAERSL